MTRYFRNVVLHRFLLALFLVFATSHVYAHVGVNHNDEGEEASLNAALHWLELSQDASGSVSTESDIANDYQSTAEALTTLVVLESSGADRVAALNTVQQSPHATTTEGVVRTLIALSNNSQQNSTLQANLLSRQNSDGGFGEFEGYSSNSLDTSLALLALQRIGADAPIAGRAVSYLIASQLNDGSFSIYAEQSSIVVTAMVLQAVRSYIYTYNISNMLSSAVEHLYASEKTRGGFGDSYWETAIILQALIPLTTNVTRYQEALDYLRAGQSADGDWNQRAYTTALAASALKMLSSVDVPADPEKAVVSGVFVDSKDGSSIEGVAIDVLGTATESVALEEDGTFVISNIDPDSYVFSYSAPGYLGASQNITLTKGQLVNVGTIPLEIAPTTVLISGVITDATTSAPLSGVTVSAVTAGQVIATTTSSTGAYQLITSPGVVTITVTVESYRTVTVSSDLVAGNQLQFSPSLLLASEEPPAVSTLFGVVIDEQGLPVDGATITVNGGAGVTTVGDGAFELTGLSSEEVAIVITKAGYQTTSFSVVVPDRTTANAGSIVMRQQVDLAVTAVTGRVTDLVSGDGVAAVSVVIGSLSTTTDLNGFYNIFDVPVLEFTVSANAAGYLTSDKTVTLAEHTQLTLNISIRQADLGGVNVASVTTEQESYGAFEPVIITTSIVNNTAVSQEARLFVTVKNASDQEVARFSGAFVPPLDPMSGLEEIAHYQQHLEEAIEKFSPDEQREITLEQWWNTLSIEPGTYTVTVQALDSVTSTLISERSTAVTVEPTQLITLDVKTSPSFVLLNNSENINIYAEFLNNSNTVALINFDYQLVDPTGAVITQGSMQYELPVEQKNHRIDLEVISHTFDRSGQYQLQVSNITGAKLKQLRLSSVFVPPSVRLRVTQSLDKNQVVPLEGVEVISNITVEGVDSE